MTVSDIVKAASAFQDAISESYWEEHGISDDEAAKGMLAAMHALGFCDGVSAKRIQAVWARHKRREANRNAARERARRAALTPEQRASEDRMRDMMLQSSRIMQELVLDQVFRPQPAFFNMLRSPNTQSY